MRDFLESFSFCLWWWSWNHCSTARLAVGENTESETELAIQNKSLYDMEQLRTANWTCENKRTCVSLFHSLSPSDDHWLAGDIGWLCCRDTWWAGPQTRGAEKRKFNSSQKGLDIVALLITRWASRQVRMCVSCGSTRHSALTVRAYGPSLCFQILLFSVVNPNLETYREDHCGKSYPRLARLTQYKTTIYRQLRSVTRMQRGGMCLKYVPGFIPLEMVLKWKQLHYVA